MTEHKPLFVDLDGTLIKEDLSNLAFQNSLRTNPLLTVVYLIIFLFRGKAYLKEKISMNYQVPINKLKFNSNCINFIKEVKNRHRVVYLISGSHQCLVDQINNHLKIFLEVFGTNKKYNMVGLNKVKFIREKLNFQKFDYIGNSHKDIPIWEYTENIIYTNVNKKLKMYILKKEINQTEIIENFI